MDTQVQNVISSALSQVFALTEVTFFLLVFLTIPFEIIYFYLSTCSLSLIVWNHNISSKIRFFSFLSETISLQTTIPQFLFKKNSSPHVIHCFLIAESKSDFSPEFNSALNSVANKSPEERKQMVDLLQRYYKYNSYSLIIVSYWRLSFVCLLLKQDGCCQCPFKEG